MEWGQCYFCSHYRSTKYEVPTCQKIMRPISEIKECPKEKKRVNYLKTDEQCARLHRYREYENFTYSEKLVYAFEMLINVRDMPEFSNENQ